ncbi:MAG: 3-oxoacyl-[acyl-carrier-protein] synthase 3 [Alphaproteobacteria bacterium UBA4588]|nr:MAG: 3-oxoacyl-[acyl-carrier-protein] synthase 3 [Alphaproteobacteria bacterium UBA4588]
MVDPISLPSILMVGVGGCLPARLVSNDELAKTVDTSDEWIQQRTGIKQRYLVEDERTSDLAVGAAKEALEHAGFSADDIDIIVLATTTPNDTFPSTASIVQKELGAFNAFAFDVQAVCAGFVYALGVAESLLKIGQGKKALVIGAESFSKLLDWDDRTTCVLFGDGAGAVILEAAAPADDWGVLSSVLHTDGRYRDILYVDGGPSETGTVGHVRMKGQDVFKHAVEKLSSALDEALKKAGKTPDDIDWLVPHQANLRIINGMQKKLGIDPQKVVRTVSEHANTSAASIPLALTAAVRDGRIQSGHVLAFEAIGGGLSWGASIVRFGRPS